MTRFSGLYRLGLAALAVAMVSLAANAQPPERGGDRGGRGGQFAMGGMRGGLIMLATNPQVQEELKMTEEQKTQLREAAQKAREERQGGGNFGDMSREERMAAMEKLQQQATDTLKSVLDEAQMKRLEQISLQQQLELFGARALLNDKLVAALKITEDQQAEIREIVDANRPEGARGGGRDMFQEERQQMREEMQKARQESQAKAMGVLTSDQKATLKAMTGEYLKLERPQGTRGERGDRGERGERGERGGRAGGPRET